MRPAYLPSSDGCLRQAEVLRDLAEVRVASVLPSGVELETVPHPLVVVMTQDCDLEQDFNMRTERVKGGEATLIEQDPLALQGVLLCDAYDATDPRDYLADKNQKLRRTILDNQDARYHYLDHSPGPGEGGNIPPLLLDFRKQFTVPVAPLYEAIQEQSNMRLGVVPPVFLHDLVQRFYSYQGRVALPSAEEVAELGSPSPPSSPEDSGASGSGA